MQTIREGTQLLSHIVDTQMMMQELVEHNVNSTAELAGEMQEVKDQLDVTNSLLQCLIDVQLDHEGRASSCSEVEEQTAPAEPESLGLVYINPLQVQESTRPRAHFAEEPQYLPAESVTPLDEDELEMLTSLEEIALKQQGQDNRRRDMGFRRGHTKSASTYEVRLTQSAHTAIIVELCNGIMLADLYRTLSPYGWWSNGSPEPNSHANLQLAQTTFLCHPDRGHTMTICHLEH